MSSIRKAGVAFYPGVGVSPDLTGLASTFALKYMKRGGSFVDAGLTFTEDNAGTYTAPLTLTEVGDYIVIIESSDSRIENLEGNVLVTAASIDDVNNAVTALQSDMTSVKTQIDLLDEESVNSLKTDVSNIQSTLSELSTLIDSSGYTGLKITGDVTSELEIGDEINDRDDSGSGTVVSIDFDGTDTWVTLDNRSGSWTVGDVIEVQSKPNLSGAVGAPYDDTVNPMDSVMEFVKAINDELEGGFGALGVLKGYTDNIELMLEGKQYKNTDGSIVIEENSYGLSEIYDAIDSSSGDTTYIRGKVDQIIQNVSNIGTDISNIVTQIDDLEALIDPKIDAIKTVVDANEATLEDAGYGLSALKDLLDTLTNSVGNIATDNSDVLAVLNDGVNGLEAVKTTIMNKLDAMDTKLDNITGATGSRIFI